MIRIITDSTCDLDRETAARLGIEVIPLSLHFGSQAYIDGVSIDHDTFYQKLSEADRLPTTSQLNPADILDVVLPYLEQGDDVVGIFLSSKLSGTFQSAAIAAAMSESDRFYLVDSQNVTFGMALLVHVACRLRDEGNSAAEIAAALDKLKGRVRLVAVVDTLKYLQMGGRISAASAAMGNLLGINPLVGVIDGGSDRQNPRQKIGLPSSSEAGGGRSAGSFLSDLFRSYPRTGKYDGTAECHHACLDGAGRNLLC